MLKDLALICRDIAVNHSESSWENGWLDLPSNIFRQNLLRVERMPADDTDLVYVFEDGNLVYDAQITDPNYFAEDVEIFREEITINEHKSGEWEEKVKMIYRQIFPPIQMEFIFPANYQLYLFKE
mgnify:CR=1 FL=1